MDKDHYFVAINTPHHNGQYTYDGNATLFKNNLPIYAIAQERVSRKKYDGNYTEAVNYLLDAEGISSKNLAKVVFSSFAMPIKGNQVYIQPIVEDIQRAFDLDKIRSNTSIHTMRYMPCRQVLSRILTHV